MKHCICSLFLSPSIFCIPKLITVMRVSYVFIMSPAAIQRFAVNTVIEIEIRYSNSAMHQGCGEDCRVTEHFKPMQLISF